jgi:hypothetical protein
MSEMTMLSCPSTADRLSVMREATAARERAEPAPWEPRAPSIGPAARARQGVSMTARHSPAVANAVSLPDRVSWSRMTLVPMSDLR